MKTINKKPKEIPTHEVLYFCDVPHCKNKMSMGWSAAGVGKRLCKYHFERHCDDNDSFDLFDIFNIPKLKLNVDVDKFGIPIPRDSEEMLAFVNKQHKFEDDTKKEKSLGKLHQWKENKEKNGSERKPFVPKPKVEPEIQEELDNIALNILGEI